MSFKDIFKKSFLEGFASTEITTLTVVTALGVACLLALYIFFVYRVVTRKTFYSKNFNITLAGVTVITASLILTMQSSVVLSLGMVGALSIVRFRTAIKEPMDIAFLFWSIAAGIVLSAGMIPLTVFGSVIIGVVMMLFVNRKAAHNPYIAVISCIDRGAEQRAVKFLSENVEKAVIKSKTVQSGGIELNYEVRLKGADTDFISTLSEMDGVNSAVLVSYNGDYLG